MLVGYGSDGPASTATVVSDISEWFTGNNVPLGGAIMADRNITDFYASRPCRDSSGPAAIVCKLLYKGLWESYPG